MLTGTNLKYAKAYNYRIVLETIRLYAPLSRADIARRTELTPQTVSNIAKQLMKTGLIREAHRRQEGRGAPSTLLAIDPGGAYSIGLDLDKDHLTGVLVDLGGTVRQRVSYDLNFPSPEEALDLLEKTARALVEAEGLTCEQLWGVGVGLPGPLGVSEGSAVMNFVNPKAFPGWKNVPIVELLSRRLALPVMLENNATAAAVGERWYGEGRHIASFFYIYFGAGLGGGLILNGHPYEGHTGNAGELGYFPAVHDPSMGEVEARSGFRRPHLGMYFNLPRLYARLQAQGLDVSHPGQLETLYREGHADMLDWVDTGTQHLAPLILAIEYLIDPEAIFFGGRLPDVIIEGMMDRLDRLLPTLRIEGKPSVPALLNATAGADAAALGVATLPLYASFAPAPAILMKRGDADGTFSLVPGA